MNALSCWLKYVLNQTACILVYPTGCADEHRSVPMTRKDSCELIWLVACTVAGLGIA